ncbi:diacylglycerol/lipid kinase family protein [Enemella sp. A6]|uniref:diacylglycerol/lipid kinase family protein n=1 Tax=Enemella sp. A6 TaxID=3440152 RepID=UPI003EBE7C2A
MAKVALILNPMARPAGHARLLELVREAVGDLTIARTTPEEPGSTQAARSVDEGAELVIAAGGDGTARSVALGLAGTGVPMAVIGLGTANVLARNLGLPRGVAGQLRVALTGATKRVDVGRVAFGVGDHDWSVEDGFVVLAGVGHDAAVFADTDKAVKRKFGWPAYLLRGTRRMTHPPLPMRITIDGVETDTEAWSLLVGNYPGIPAGVQVFPGARPDDGLLEVLQARVKHPVQWVPVAVSGFTRLPVWGAGLVRSRAREVIVHLPTAAGVQLDGDPVQQTTRVRFRVDPGALLIRMPARGAARP